MIKIPRLDLLIGRASVSREPATEQELKQLKPRLILLSLVLFAAVFLAFFYILIEHSTLVFFASTPLLALIAALLTLRMIFAFGNVTPIGGYKHPVLHEFISDGYMPQDGLEFISRVAAMGRSLTEGEAVSLIALAKKHKGKVQTAQLGGVAESSLSGSKTNGT